MTEFITIAAIMDICLFGNATANQYDKYGGWNELKADSTGYFKAEKIGDTWWLIDPDGNAFISKGVNNIGYSGDNAPTLGYAPYGRVTKEKYGDIHKWGEASIKRLWNWNFNTIGSWSNHELFDKGMPYTVIMGFGSALASTWEKGLFPDIFAPGFEVASEKHARDICVRFKDDPDLVGYFTDNELRWGSDWRSSKTLFDDFLALPASADGKKALVNLISETYGSVDKLNSAWQINLNSFDDLLNITELSQLGEPLKTSQDELSGNLSGIQEKSPTALEIKKIRSAFLYKVAKRYFSVCEESIRKFDQNHLILGCRFAGYAPTEVLEAMKDHIDVVSYNNYSQDAPISKLKEIYEITGKPMMLTEFSFKAMDSGLPNTKGAGVPVETQQDRADGFARYVEALMKLPFMVGYHWFEHADEPAEGRFDGENSNYGVVNIKDETWEILVNRMTDVNAKVEDIHITK